MAIIEENKATLCRTCRHGVSVVSRCVAFSLAQVSPYCRVMRIQPVAGTSVSTSILLHTSLKSSSDLNLVCLIYNSDVKLAKKIGAQRGIDKFFCNWHIWILITLKSSYLQSLSHPHDLKPATVDQLTKSHREIRITAEISISRTQSLVPTC